MALVDLCLFLELDDGNRLVHKGGEANGLLVDIGSAATQAGLEFHARVVAIRLHGERSQRNEIDAIAVFQRSKIGIAQGEANDVTDACLVARTGTHPENVVVAPRDVPSVVTLHHVQYQVCARTTVVDVA